AEAHYGASFPIAAKAEVYGTNPHPFYKWAAGQRPLDKPRWNFHKYLIGRDGLIAASFPSDVEPTDARVIAAIEKELPRPATDCSRARAMRPVLIVILCIVLVRVLLAGGFVAATWAPELTVDDLKPRWAPPPSVFLDVGGLQVHLRDEGPRDDLSPLVLL